ncbi:allantoate amidohydrolase [Actinomadura flavalba]|uniref:allantoate amidohydrolase n=1 Tax=Actinomadura flavalba TaxID=1120938 RepID=UPI0003706430|nr:allantoate amidohydrolase [Actinomadura flavalba]
MTFEAMWADLLPVGRSAATGGYHRFAWTAPELECRAWFEAEAAGRGLALEPDANGNLFAWWYPADGRRDGAVLTGSHLDSVPGGGAFDGPLGVVTAFAALDALRERGFAPRRPLVVAAFAEEEGARFGVACLGSRLLTGAITPERARALRDGDGATFADVIAEHGLDPAAIGPDEALLGRLAYGVELHVEQGRALVGPVGVASSIIPHGRWRFGFTGQGDHAGTTALRDRRDPMLPFAAMVLAARQAAERNGTLATVGKVAVDPGGVNAIAASVTAWLDGRGPVDDAVRRTVTEIERAARLAAVGHDVKVDVAEESYTPLLDFPHALRDHLRALLGDVPLLPTGAGHDAGILAARIPTAMLYVRNPTGISHAPSEHADIPDCLAGVTALAQVLEDLLEHP